MLFGTIVGGLSGLAFGVVDASNHLKSVGLVYNSRAGITAGTRFCCLQGAWFAGYFSIFQLWKFSVCRAAGNNDMTTTAPATMAAFLPMVAVKAWRRHVPCALMLCALDFYHEHREDLGF